MTEQSSSEKIPVAVLAATGTVGQRFVSLLDEHPWFEIAVVTASERSEGRRYADVVNWQVPGPIPPRIAAMTVRATNTDLGHLPLVFSALPSSVAKHLEPKLAQKGYLVCSNASAHRMTADVPLLIPEVNPDHIELLDIQRKKRGWPGGIVAAPNCSTTGVIFPLKILHEAFGVEAAHIVTMQAISGAGYPGVPSMEILDNIVPYIGGEEKKIETESTKLLGTVVADEVIPAATSISAQTTRVPVMDGHFAALSIKLMKRVSLDKINEALTTFTAPEKVDELPSTPDKPVVVRLEEDRPQPRRDRDAGGGMTVSLGRVQPCPVLDVRLLSLVHNTVRGAAGGAIHNAEWLKINGYLDKKKTSESSMTNSDYVSWFDDEQNILLIKYPRKVDEHKLDVIRQHERDMLIGIEHPVATILDFSSVVDMPHDLLSDLPGYVVTEPSLKQPNARPVVVVKAQRSIKLVYDTVTFVYPELEGLILFAPSTARAARILNRRM